MDALPENLAVWKGGLVLAWALAFFLAERWRPASPPPAEIVARQRARQRLGRNLGLWALNLLLSPLIILPLTYWASGQGMAWRPAWWAGTTGLLLDLLLLDFLIYWWHRANHVVPFLWRFHAVHHRDRFLDTTSALRFHFGEVLLSAGARALVILMLGLPFSSVLVFETLVLLAALFHHSNLALPAKLERGLSAVVITPAIHWVHHHDRRADTDSNYGTVLSIWDPLFGSRSRTERRAGMTIGIEGGVAGDPRDGTLLGLLVQPFRGPWRQTRD